MAETMVRLRASPTSVMREMPRRLPMMDEFVQQEIACFFSPGRLVLRLGSGWKRSSSLGEGEGEGERGVVVEVDWEKRI